jgi:hypothetical protein
MALATRANIGRNVKPQGGTVYYDSYAEFQADLDDRDDTYDPEFRDHEGYCPHGKYVGGCGADLMCGWCEDGISVSEAKRIITMERTRTVREAATQCQNFLNVLLSKHGTEVGGIEIYELSQRCPYPARNPLTRYGRH